LKDFTEAMMASIELGLTISMLIRYNNAQALLWHPLSNLRPSLAFPESFLRQVG
jgi:hypothetical protein